MEKTVGYCALVQADVTSPPPYKALSYTWDAVPAGRQIVVDGQAFFVRRNLEKALRRFRAATEEVWLWVDAIYINQNDVHERSRHFAYMHRVYEEAEEVVIWLGDAADDSHFLLRQLYEFHDAMCSEAAADTFHHWQSLFQSGGFIKALAKLLGRRWWTKMWTMQESVCARSLSLYCGPDKISQQMLYSLGAVAEREAHSPLLTSTHNVDIGNYTQIGILQEFQSLHRGSTPVDLEQTLKLVRLRGVTDLRDKVYAVLNICTSQEWPIRPDYGKSPSRVFTEVAQHLITSTRSLSILSSCEYPGYPIRQDFLRQDRQLSSVVGLPTWVPDWTRTRLSAPLVQDYGVPLVDKTEDPHHADGGAIACYEFQGQCLKVKGFVYDEIADCCPIFVGPSPNCFAQMNSAQIYRQLLDWISTRDLNRILDSLDRTELLFRTLTGNLMGNTHAGFQKVDDEGVAAFSNWLMTDGDEQISYGLLRVILKTSHFRRLIVTKRGFLGLAHVCAKPVDNICIFLGASVPLIIRTSHPIYIHDKEKCTVHKMVSDCHFNGCFKGKMMVDTQRCNMLVGDCCKHDNRIRDR